MPNFNTSFFSNPNRQSQLVLQSQESSLNTQFQILSSNDNTLSNVFLNANQFDSNSIFGQSQTLTTTTKTTTTQSTFFSNQFSIGQRVTNTNELVRNTCVLPQNVQIVQNNNNNNITNANYLAVQNPYSLDLARDQVCVTEVIQQQTQFLHQVNESFDQSSPSFFHATQQQQRPIIQEIENFSTVESPNSMASGGDDDDDDGMTHSLPCKKYGPYTCPRCEGVFATSQMFAAHMGTHYKHETVDQKRKRLMAKYRKRKTARLINLHENRISNNTKNIGGGLLYRDSFDVPIKYHI